MPTTIFNFETPSNYTYDSDKIEFVNSNTQNPELTFYADYNTSIDATFSEGSITETASGGASVSDGKLDLTYSDIRYVDYDAEDNVQMVNTGCFRFLVTPNYSGSPVNSGYFFTVLKAGSSNNKIHLFHAQNGNLVVEIRSSSGVVIISNNLGVWSPTSGTEYEIELNFDITSGETRLFIDGTQFGSTLAMTGTRENDVDVIRIGSNNAVTTESNFEIDDFTVFSDVQHTANYVPETEPPIDSVARLVDNRPDNATFYAAFTGLDGNWGGGNLTAIGAGGIAVSGGELIVDADTKYVDYDADLNADSQQVGCIRFRVTPTYAGNPASDVHFLTISKANADSDNLISIFHQSGGQIVITINDSGGSSFVVINAGWAQVQNQQYEFELNWDVTTGVTKFFIDGSQYGATSSGTGTRDSNIGLFRIGQNISKNQGTGFKMADILVFDSVQHTTNYTPDWSNIPETVYDMTNPQVTINAAFTHDAVEDFVEVSAKSGSDEIKYILEIDSVKNYHNGSAWVVSDGTYAQSNTETEIVANLSTITSVRVTSRFFAFLHSDDGSTTPEIDSLTVTYNFAGTTRDSINRCAVWFYSLDGEGLVSNETVTFRIPKKLIQYKDNIIAREDDIVITPESDGYVEANLVETENMTTIDGSDVLYEVEIDDKKYYFEVPNQENALLFDLITA